MSDSLQPHVSQHTRLPCPLPITRCLLKLMSFELVMLFNHLILCHPLLLLPSILPSIRVFQMSQFFASDGQNIGASASASVLSINIQNWLPSGLTGVISFLFKELSRVFSSTTVRKHQFSALRLLYAPTLIPIHDYWKNHSFDYTDLFLAKWCLCFLICCLGLS